MLVLTRKKGESIVIADNIVLTVLSIDGENVKIGIEAPREIDIYRKEVIDAIQENNKYAAMDMEGLKNIIHQLSKHDE